MYLFISPPNLTSLLARLQGRGTETESSLHKRLATAHEEMAFAKESNHDVVIVNDDLDRAYSLLEELALGEKIAGDELPPLDD